MRPDGALARVRATTFHTFVTHIHLKVTSAVLAARVNHHGACITHIC